LVIKTKKELFSKLAKKVKSLHSYTVPEIIALPIIAGNKDYLKWINDSTR
jgi:periplasmic divalent cation tolerance protein